MPEDNTSPTTTPITPIEPGTIAPIADVAEGVEQAAAGATAAARATSEDGWKVIAEELKGLRGDIAKLMEKPSAVIPPVPTEPVIPVAAAPDVSVETPKPAERKIRRGGRKVTRHAK